jgi:threonine dehydratase
MKALFERDRLIVEGSGAVGAAAVLAGKIEPAEGPTVLILSGGNVDPKFLASLSIEAPVHVRIPDAGIKRGAP